MEGKGVISVMVNDQDDRLIRALRQDHESRDVDYKAAMVWDTKAGKAACCGIVKDILAMANSGGGLIVLGVDEMPDKSFQRSGVPSPMLASWETTRVNSFVQTYADPPINVLVRRFTDTDLTFIALDVPPFPSVPHICVSAYPEELRRFVVLGKTMLHSVKMDESPLLPSWESSAGRTGWRASFLTVTAKDAPRRVGARPYHTRLVRTHSASRGWS